MYRIESPWHGLDDEHALRWLQCYDEIYVQRVRAAVIPHPIRSSPESAARVETDPAPPRRQSRGRQSTAITICLPWRAEFAQAMLGRYWIMRIHYRYLHVARRHYWVARVRRYASLTCSGGSVSARCGLRLVCSGREGLCRLAKLRWMRRRFGPEQVEATTEGGRH
jgi:hypothetical protein